MSIAGGPNVLRPTRRTFLASAAAACAGSAIRLARGADELSGAEPESTASELPDDGGVPMLHVSDLFRPHNDPDDHWDLACVYALAMQGRVDLRGVLIDFPQPERSNDPDVQAVAQMNYLSGKAVGVMVGSPRSLSPAEASRPEAKDDLRGVHTFLEILRASSRPVVVSILGSCRDVAIAGQLEPDLFASNCRAIYLNAGSGTPDPSRAERLEWNVHLDPASFAAIFRLPCPVYWMPCFEEVPQPGRPFEVARYGTFYRFRQADVLPQLPPRLQNFFAYMYRDGQVARRSADAVANGGRWLQYLLGPVDFNVIQQQANLYRNMWCTAGFLHACGLSVTRSGQIVAQSAAGDPVFSFEPVRVECSPAGVTRWEPATGASSRQLFQVRHSQEYATAMTTALTTLLSTFSL